MAWVDVEVWSRSTGEGWRWRIDDEALTLSTTTKKVAKTKRYESFAALESAFTLAFSTLLDEHTLFNFDNREVRRVPSLKQLLKR